MGLESAHDVSRNCSGWVSVPAAGQARLYDYKVMLNFAHEQLPTSASMSKFCLCPGVNRCDAMTAALEALSGVSVTSATSDRLELRLTTHVAHDHLTESGCGPCLLCWKYIHVTFTQGNIMFWLQISTAHLMCVVAGICSAGIS